MNGNTRFLLGVACGVGLALLPRAAGHLHAAVRALQDGPAASGAARAHTEEHFSFTAHAPMNQVVPLFGAEKERLWTPDWHPEFVRPNPAADVPGMVFTVAHSHFTSVWVNTAFDLQNGRVQYVYTIPEHLVTVITLSVRPDGQQTHVDVEYDRTSLRPEADAFVQKMAKQDRESGPDWEKQINAYLEKRTTASLQ
jgi:hypothetical protein